ncbi:phage minor head protein [Deinococcus irradiatisoli]|uniref:phage minor head protein n=1 Tax=Deinococcus irradiatisoli TaxID=2202254 RepID=UPI0015E83891|nr:phage minor head protein [Deinococcus irradiatisoli]
MGESLREIAQRIKGLHADWSDARAELISRTEVSTAFWASHQLSADQAAADAGVEMIKVWRSAHDSRVRDKHAAMDGEEVRLDEDFNNGLRYPSGPNCRCTVLYREKGS